MISDAIYAAFEATDYLDLVRRVTLGERELLKRAVRAERANAKRAILLRAKLDAYGREKVAQANLDAFDRTLFAHQDALVVDPRAVERLAHSVLAALQATIEFDRAD